MEMGLVSESLLYTLYPLLLQTLQVFKVLSAHQVGLYLVRARWVQLPGWCFYFLAAKIGWSISLR